MVQTPITLDCPKPSNLYSQRKEEQTFLHLMIEWPLSVFCWSEVNCWMPVREPVEKRMCRCVKGGKRKCFPATKESDSWHLHSFMSLTFDGVWFVVTHLPGARDSRMGNEKSICHTISTRERIRWEIICDCVPLGGKIIYIFPLNNNLWYELDFRLCSIKHNSPAFCIFMTYMGNWLLFFKSLYVGP